MKIETTLVKYLIEQQFPQWAGLSIRPVSTSGWDNRTFHLGENMSVRLPSDAQYASQVAKEQYWLPKLQSHLPLMIPKPIAMGEPSKEYPWHWSIYQWLDGADATNANVDDHNIFASTLAKFLKALQQCDISDAPQAGSQNFYRGGNLSVYDSDTRKAIAKIENKNLAKKLVVIWENALASTWQYDPVWIHGDIAVGNLLVKDGKLVAVIDFGQLAIGDPACDLAIYWIFLSGESREIFRQILNLDDDTWDRARGWVLWKTLCAPIAGTNCENIIDLIVEEFKNEADYI